MQDSLENSESKREFFTKYPQVKFYLVGTYFWSWPLSSKYYQPTSFVAD